MSNMLDAKIPPGPIAEKWSKYKSDVKLVNPANKRKFTVIIVGSGLAGGAAAATLAELGYNVLCFCYQDSPRRAHSIAAQGGINAAKNYQNDGDSVWRLFYDTIKGGDFRAREANVYRLAEVSAKLRDVNQLSLCVASEGGWSDHELLKAASCDFTPVSLGTRTLRTETAAIVAVALAQHIFGDML